LKRGGEGAKRGIRKVRAGKKKVFETKTGRGAGCRGRQHESNGAKRARGRSAE